MLPRVGVFFVPFDSALEALVGFNNSPVYLGADSLIHQHFSSAAAALEPSTVAERVVLLDALWSTQMFRESGAHARVIASIRAHGQRVLDLLSGLDAGALQGAGPEPARAATELLPLFLGVDERGGGRKHYSFASKFLHWLTRVHFPSVDSRVRTAVLALQRAHAGPGLIPTEWSSPEQDYQLWIRFYRDLLGSMSDQERARMLETDLESQTACRRHQNSLLRIWDKVFYHLGSTPAALTRCREQIRADKAAR